MKIALAFCLQRTVGLRSNFLKVTNSIRIFLKQCQLVYPSCHRQVAPNCFGKMRLPSSCLLTIYQYQMQSIAICHYRWAIKSHVQWAMPNKYLTLYGDVWCAILHRRFVTDKPVSNCCNYIGTSHGKPITGCSNWIIVTSMVAGSTQEL